MSRLTRRNKLNRAYCIAEATPLCDAHCLVCKENRSILEKLAYYEDLEEQGRLIELPCKVGDTVYVIGTFTGQLTEDKVHTFEVSPSEIVLLLDCGYVVFVAQQLGKTVFLTKEEAEAKLAELKGTEE